MHIKRELSTKLTLFRSSRFPYARYPKKNFRYVATVGIGGNLGDVQRRFEHLFYFLKRSRVVELLQTSLILQNPPFGYIKQDDFFNSIMIVKTDMQARVFLDFLMRVEKKFSRKRSFANAPRTLDLDIIFFDNRSINTKKLQVPHKEWHKRESVVIPLASMSL